MPHQGTSINKTFYAPWRRRRRRRRLPSGSEARRSASWPCSTSDGTARNEDAPDSPPTGRSDLRSVASSPDRTRRSAEGPPCASICGPVIKNWIKTNPTAIQAAELIYTR